MIQMFREIRRLGGIHISNFGETAQDVISLAKGRMNGNYNRQPKLNLENRTLVIVNAVQSRFRSYQ